MQVPSCASQSRLRHVLRLTNDCLLKTVNFPIWLGKASLVRHA